MSDPADTSPAPSSLAGITASHIELKLFLSYIKTVESPVIAIVHRRDSFSNSLDSYSRKEGEILCHALLRLPDIACFCMYTEGA